MNEIKNNMCTVDPVIFLIDRLHSSIYFIGFSITWIYSLFYAIHKLKNNSKARVKPTSL